jgi:mono/diheme cytochrome c family protein
MISPSEPATSFDRAAKQRNRAFVIAALVAISIVAVVAQTTGPKRDAGGVPAPTAALERGRTVYVLSACHFCHGIDLTGAQMGAADLMHDRLVAADQHGERIGPIVLAGLPNLQTAMPKYADMTPQQVRELAAYIHFLRAQGRFKELTTTTNRPSGNSGAGQIYFDAAGQCGSCHSATRDLKGISKKYDAVQLRANALRPSASLPIEGIEMNAGGRAHQKILETISTQDAENLLAYLLTL